MNAAKNFLESLLRNLSETTYSPAARSLAPRFFYQMIVCLATSEIIG